MSLGSRSGVNCSLEKDPLILAARAFAARVFPTPGTSSSSRCSPAISEMTSICTSSSFPKTTLLMFSRRSREVSKAFCDIDCGLQKGRKTHMPCGRGEVLGQGILSLNYVLLNYSSLQAPQIIARFEVWYRDDVTLSRVIRRTKYFHHQIRTRFSGLIKS